MTQKRVLKKLFFLLLVFFISAVIVVCVAEIGMRIFMKTNPSELFVQREEYFPYLACLPTKGLANPDKKYVGYNRKGWLYQYKGKQTISYVGQRYHFMFHDKEREALNQDNYRIFFLGGSAAAGIGTTGPARYFEILEKAIDRPYSVKTVPAAFPGINSVHENILFHLLLLPNNPDFVVIFDGFNDVGLVPMFQCRPGDPAATSIFYGLKHNVFFNARLWLAVRSRLYATLALRSLIADISEYQEMLCNDKKFRNALMTSITNIYLDNVEQMIESCRLRNIEVLYVLQPSPDLLIMRRDQGEFSIKDSSYAEFVNRTTKTPGGLLRPADFIAQTYEHIINEIHKRPIIKECFIDISEEFDLNSFIDFVHLNKNGQKILAKELLPYLEKKIPAQLPANR